MRGISGNTNKSAILELLRSAEMRTRIELAQITGLSVPTVMKWVDEFTQKGLVQDAGLGASTGGKPPRLLRFNFRSHYIVGVDINWSRIDAVLTDMAANVLSGEVRDICACNSPEQIVSRVTELIQIVVERSGVDKSDILGIGVSVTGIVDRRTGVLRRFDPFDWKNVDMITPIAKRFGLPVIVENDAKAAAMGEMLAGIAADYDNFACVNVHEDVDAALVVNRELVYGSGAVSNTLGHFSVDPEGILCECGRRGCLNTIVTSRAIEKKARDAVRALGEGQGCMLLDMAYGYVDRINIYTIIEAAENGDELSVGMLKNAADCLATAIANIACLTDPEAVILDGKLLRNSNVFYGELYSQTKREMASISGSPVDIRLASLGKHLCAIGVASMILNLFVENGGENLPLNPQR